MKKGNLNDALIDRSRLRAVEKSGLLDSPIEAFYDSVADDVCEKMDVPVSMVAVIDMNRQFLKSQKGLPDPFSSEREMPLTHTFCQGVVRSGRTLAVNDMTKDPTYFRHPAVKDYSVRAYLGEPVMLDGEVIGTVCAIDFRERQWTVEDVRILQSRAAEIERKLTAQTDDIVQIV